MLYNAIMTVGQKMKLVLKTKKISQYDAADRLGISQPRLNQWLNNVREPSLYDVDKFCQTFAVSPNYLFSVEKGLVEINQEELIEIISIIEEVLSEKRLKMTTIDKIKLAYALFEELEQKQTHTAKILYISDYLNNKKSA